MDAWMNGMDDIPKRVTHILGSLSQQQMTAQLLWHRFTAQRALCEECVGPAPVYCMGSALCP